MESGTRSAWVAEVEETVIIRDHTSLLGSDLPTRLARQRTRQHFELEDVRNSSFRQALLSRTAVMRLGDGDRVHSPAHRLLFPIGAQVRVKQFPGDDMALQHASVAFGHPENAAQDHAAAAVFHAFYFRRALVSRLVRRGRPR